MGPVTTAVLLAEIGEDRERYPRPEVLFAEAGPAPVTGASSRSRSVRFRYAANTRLREGAMGWACKLHSVYDQPDRPSVHAQFDGPASGQTRSRWRFDTTNAGYADMRRYVKLSWTPANASVIGRGT